MRIPKKVRVRNRNRNRTTTQHTHISARAIPLSLFARRPCLCAHVRACVCVCCAHSQYKCNCARSRDVCALRLYQSIAPRGAHFLIARASVCVVRSNTCACRFVVSLFRHSEGARRTSEMTAMIRMRPPPLLHNNHVRRFGLGCVVLSLARAHIHTHHAPRQSVIANVVEIH